MTDIPVIEPRRLARLRAACFRWFDQMNRTAEVSAVPIYERGRRTDIELAEVFDRTPSQRSADIERAASLPPMVVRPTSSAARSALVSPTRFLAWYLPRYWARTLPTPRVATDWASAVADAGLVDVDATRFPGVYTVTPRDAIPTWEVHRDVKPHVTPSVRPFLGTPIRPYGRLTAAEYVEAVEQGYTPRSMVPSAIADASAADPGRYFPAASRLQRDAREYLAEFGEVMPLPDVFDTKRMRWHSRPDRVAFRGVARFKRPAPMRYQRKVSDSTPIGVDGQLELATILTRPYYCRCGPARAAIVDHYGRTLIGTTRGMNPNRDRCACVPYGWRGHRRDAFPRVGKAKRVAKRDAARAARPVATSSRGRSVGPWAMSDRSLSRAAVPVAAIVADIERVLRTTADGRSVIFPNGTRVTITGAAQVFDIERGRTYPVREWARRAALAGLSLPTSS